MECYFSGQKLYGDSFSQSEIDAWYRDEEEGYASLASAEPSDYRYAYHGLNRFHGYDRLPTAVRFKHALGFGSAFGDEFMPVARRIDRITVIDPSSAFVRASIHGVPSNYVKPAPSGRLPLADNTFDLATCFGALHHVPNVSFVLKEIARVLCPQGWLLVREPCVSMGDWRQPRPGLTRRERGIPAHLLQRAARDAGLHVVHSAPCDFPVVARLGELMRRQVYNSGWGTRVDYWLSLAFAWNRTYHATTRLQRLRPASSFLVVQKPAASADAT